MCSEPRFLPGSPQHAHAASLLLESIPARRVQVSTPLKTLVPKPGPLAPTCHERHAVDGWCRQQQQEGEAVAWAKHVHHVAHHHTGGDGATHCCDTGVTHIMAGEVQRLSDHWEQGLRMQGSCGAVVCLKGDEVRNKEGGDKGR